ncbi:MAG: LacI family DNA-binding transcriptional regulator [Phycisphaerae bacterium]
MVTLKDIARTSGVSVRTVSRVLKNSGYARPDTRRRVLEVAREMGYRPNRFARSLRTQKSYEVAVITWSLDELHMAKIAGFEQALRRAGYSVTLLFGAESESEDFDEMLEELLSRRPAAVASFSPARVPIREWVQALAQAQLPYVVFDSSEDVDTVRIDRQQGVYEAALYLAARGKKRIAYLGSREDSTRIEGYERALSQLDLSPIYLEPGKSRIDSARGVGSRWRQMDPRPDAIQAYSDEVAMALLMGLHEHGISVPEDVSVIGFDDLRAAALTSPPLTTVAQPSREVGRAAADVILRKIGEADPPADGWSRSLPTRLIIREST